MRSNYKTTGMYDKYKFSAHLKHEVSLYIYIFIATDFSCLETCGIQTLTLQVLPISFVEFVE